MAVIDVHGLIERWEVHENRIHGYIYCCKGICDGYYILTPEIHPGQDLKPGGLVQTRNHLYLLGLSKESIDELVEEAKNAAL